jgi:hypothetical protein
MARIQRCESCDLPVVHYPVLTSIMQLPKCTAYPGSLSVIIMDNAKIHHGAEILALFDRFGMALRVIAPPFSLLKFLQVFVLNIFHHTHQI